MLIFYMLNSNDGFLTYFHSGFYVEYIGGDINKPDKKERKWTNNQLNFDDVTKAMLTLFTVATFEGWPKLVSSSQFNFLRI